MSEHVDPQLQVAATDHVANDTAETATTAASAPAVTTEEATTAAQNADLTTPEAVIAQLKLLNNPKPPTAPHSMRVAVHTIVSTTRRWQKHVNNLWPMVATSLNSWLLTSL